MKGEGVFLAGGGTGGHLVPGLVLAQALAAEGLRPLLVTGRRAVEDTVLGTAAWPRLRVSVEGGLLRSLPALGVATVRMALAMRRERARGVVVLGGRVALPAGLAAGLLGLPLALLEINAAPGRAIRLLAPLARRIYLGLPGSDAGLPARKIRWTGIPLRPSFRRLPEPAAAAAGLGLPPGPGPVLLVFGGSMGAESLNQAVLSLLARPGALPGGTRVVHLTGTGMAAAAEAAWREAGITALVAPFLAAMELAYAAADLVVCRGGAMTIGEVAASRRPAVVVPFPWHRDRHQERNGRALGAGAVVLPQADLALALAPTVGALLADRGRRQAMAAALEAAPAPADVAALGRDLAALLGWQGAASPVSAA